MSTQKAFFSYEEIIDLHTESDRVSVIGIHTPTGSNPHKMAPGFWQQFRKFKYLGCSVTLVPAATLPADPLAVEYEGGEAVIDPRDLLNPILFHGCHGNDLGDILNRLYASNGVGSTDLSFIKHSDSLDLWSMANGEDGSWPISEDIDNTLLEDLYYKALTDRQWKKANIQRGFRIPGLHPRVYSLGTTHQIMFQNGLGSGDMGLIHSPFSGDVEGNRMDIEDNASRQARFFTPKTIPLGWLDTRNVTGYGIAKQEDNVDLNEVGEVLSGMIVDAPLVELPRIYMGVILLPPAYKKEFYFRMVIKHSFAFAGFRGISMSNVQLNAPTYDDWNEAINDEEGDDPDPDPPEPPAPVYAEKVVVSGPVAGMTGVYSGTTYSKMDIYDSAGNVVFSLEGNADANYISTAQGSGISGAPWLGTPSGTELTYPTIILMSSGGGINFARQNNYQSSTVLANFDDFIDELENNGNTVSTTFTTLADLKAAWQYEVVVADDE